MILIGVSIKMIGENYWVVLFNENKIVGYTPTFQEADDICKNNNNYSWDFARRVFKSEQKRIEMFNTLEQLTI